MKFNQILQKYRDQAFSERDKGTRFERLMQVWLQTDPMFKPQLGQVWLWNEFPGRKDFGGKDTGIDLVAKTVQGDYWAVQCKCFDEHTAIDKPAVDSFLATSSRTFRDEQLQNTAFANRLWISTTNKWGLNAEETIHNQQPPVHRVSLADLEASPVDWQALENGVHGTQARLAQKVLRPHQTSALEACHEHFKTADRGRLIMACGTGKTFTSLKIAEHETNGQGLVLFLVPSIALLGQTLREWSAESTKPINPICVCSDVSVSRKSSKNDDTNSFSIEDLALPATTDPQRIAEQLFAYRSTIASAWPAAKTAQKPAKQKAPGQETPGLTVIFSTYQSIEAVAAAQRLLNKSQPDSAVFDLVICDEAHRTTGVTLADEDESAFVRVHDNSFLATRKRLYMTATPRLYSDDTKQKAAEADIYLCSMDDPAIYGEEFYRIGFGEAVEKQLLADYKVLVLTLSDDQIPEALQAAIADGSQEINTDDASKLIGCINALSKRMLLDSELLVQADPNPMRRAVAFCQNIKVSKRTKDVFNTQKDLYYNSLEPDARAGLVTIEADHVDGGMGAATRDQKLSWLKSVPEDSNDCRILCNVRCLSEGVDVPSLDAVLFLSARNSQIDVVQSVGRVMRNSPGKKYGYIIIPVVIPAAVSAEEALNDNERFKVVWTVLNALRAHDDRFNAMVNKLELNLKKPDARSGGGSVLVGGLPDKPWNWDDGQDHERRLQPGQTGSPGASGPTQPSAAPQYGPDGKQRFADAFQQEFAFRFEELQSVIYARMVKKVGNKRYWEQWAQSVADIARRHIERITRLVSQSGPHQSAFADFLSDLRANINPAVAAAEAIEMLAQHIITKPVFEALFENYSFVRDNPVSKAMQRMVDLLEAQSLAKDQADLEKFYESVRLRAAGIDNAAARQRVIVELYDKFFRTAFPQVVEKLGIVYTPVEVVDFIIHSVAAVLKQDFGRSLSDENVHILDPFTGTGTFITRLLHSGHIRPADLERKYRHELHANEIVLLAYYIASINIENVYHDLVEGEGLPPAPASSGAMRLAGSSATPSYHSFPGICLTDSFQLYENGDSLLTGMFPENSGRIEEQRKAPVRVIIGNPPYSVGQKSANDNAQNQSYPKLEERIEQTYVQGTAATNKNSLYDSYIKAFRWASDRLDPKNGGIVAFVSNAGWLDGNAMDGFRKCLQAEFSSIYVFNLRGNCRTSGELRQREAGNVFGLGSRTPIAVTLLVKQPGKTMAAAAEPAKISYYDIGDYLNREEKLAIIARMGSVASPEMAWTILQPNEHGDWLNLRDDLFGSFIPMDADEKFQKASKSYFIVNSRGFETARDAWVYNYSQLNLHTNVQKMISFYNSQVAKFKSVYEQNQNIVARDFVEYDLSSISWSSSLLTALAKVQETSFEPTATSTAMYRPFVKNVLYHGARFIHRRGQHDHFFPTPKHPNRVICVPGTGASKDQMPIMSDCIPDLHFNGDTQCFPLYWYEKTTVLQNGLFDEAGSDQYVRRDGISDFIFTLARQKYGPRVSKEDIFYYVYGFLHCPEYRSRYSADLKKMLPRLPLVEKPADFWAFSKTGRQLAELHINYESAEPYPLQEVGSVASLKVEKMRFPSKTDKSAVIYNSSLTLTGIPERAHDYVVNGRSALEWLLDRYQVTVHKESRIKNDPNDWCAEQNNPRYIVDLVKRIVTVSLQTLDLIDSLPAWQPETAETPDSADYPPDQADYNEAAEQPRSKK